MKKNILFTLLLVVALMGGCRKDSPEVVHPSEESYDIHSENYWSNTFDSYWSTMNQSYLFWKYETTDWDAIYEEYAPKFAEVDDLFANDYDEYMKDDDNMLDWSGDEMCYGDAAACSLFEEVVSNLIDHHYGLYLYQAKKSFSASAAEIKSRDYYHESSSSFELFTTGLESVMSYERGKNRITDFKSGKYKADVGSSDLYMISYLIDGYIPYLYLSAFSISAGAEDEDDPGFETPLTLGDATKSEVLENFERLARNTDGMKGAIIDVRFNGGGYNDDLDKILGRFINKDEKIHFANSQHKSGPNRYDYTQVTPCYINGSSEEPTFRFPIVMLANLYSVSMSEITCIASRAFSDKSIMVGERTYGGTCSLADDSYFAGGIVDVENFLLYTSTILFYDLDMNFYEGVGVTPNIEVLDQDTWGATTEDKQKEAAIEYINGL